MGQLDTGQRPVPVNGVGHKTQTFHIIAIPQAGLGIWRIVRGGMDHTFFSIDNRPTALCLHFTHFGVALRQVEAHAVAVRHLIKTVLRRDRADFHGFKQDVVTGIAGHL